MNLQSLEDFQATYEQRFGCCICFAPKLHMISGQCQHRICDECLYVDEKRRPCMDACPICLLSDSFPRKKPIVPAQVIEMQRCIGIQTCPAGCGAEMWYWEVEEHNSSCSKSSKKAKLGVKSPSRRRSRVNDIGPVSVTSRAQKSQNKPITRSSSLRSIRLRRV